MTDSTAGGEPAFSPDAHRLDLGRTNLIAVIVGVAVTAPLAWLCLTVVFDPTAGAARWVGVFFALLFGGLTAMCLVAARAATRPRGIVVDLAGIWFWHGKDWDLVAWSQMARAGVSFELPPSMPVLSLQAKVSGWVTDKAMEAIRVTDKRRTALEIVPLREEDFPTVPRLLLYRKPDKHPTPGLLAVRWYVPVVPGYHSWKDLMAAGERFGGQTWVGFFQRPWGSIGTGRVQPRG